MRHGLILVTFLAACGGGTPTTPVTADTAEPYCETGCEHDVACNGEALDVCVSECVSGVAGWVREDVLELVTDCEAALSCTADEDECFGECTPTSTHESYEATCRDSLMVCDLGTQQIDEICETTPDTTNDIGGLCLAAPEIMAELRDCFTAADASCSSYGTCLQAVLDDHGVTG